MSLAVLTVFHPYCKISMQLLYDECSVRLAQTRNWQLALMQIGSWDVSYGVTFLKQTVNFILLINKYKKDFFWRHTIGQICIATTQIHHNECKTFCQVHQIKKRLFCWNNYLQMVTIILFFQWDVTLNNSWFSFLIHYVYKGLLHRLYCMYYMWMRFNSKIP